jgi:hypothetical protein
MNEIAKSFIDAEPLSSVVFIHDYVQLVFQGLILNIYAPYMIKKGARSISSGETGYADELVSLIGISVTRVEDRDGVVSLTFSCGALVQIAANADGPEALSLHQDGSSTIVG